MSDLSRHSRHEHLDEIKHIVAIGGGHGLGRVLSALSFMKERLTGIVTTTDNGGSTGRIRQERGGIAWGDLRNCLNQIIIEPSTASALFEYRFTGEGELSGHNLGNLMLKALEDMHIRPIEAINLIRELLKVKSHIIPMSEEPVHLAASLGSGSSIVGEVSIDNLTELPQSLFLVPMVKAAQEAIQALEQAEVILLGPGSFMTSIMPPLLLPELATDRIQKINEIVGEPVINGAITPYREKSAVDLSAISSVKILAKRLNADDVSYRHDRTLLAKAIDELVGELDYE